ncbi:glycosyltransferase [Flagellimonas olearia]|uniref:Glycosyltransferase n=1 Tax=Flagellimonas olearia TaxID=552546 RepID=A0A6I1DXT3_9FLAO|nr:glycosyltransferase [Allomuricauda olearia]KAB7528671.1 glycosyltransferase [Allomuricauda olearia]
MRVVHIVEALGGGVYTYFKDLSAFISENESDIEFYLIYSPNRKEIDKSRIEEDLSKSFKMIEISMVRELSLSKDFRSTHKVYKALKSISPDVVHLHSSKASVIGRVANAFLFRKNTVFYTPHGYSFLRKDIPVYQTKIYWVIEKGTQALFGGVTIACGDTEYLEARKIGTSLLVRNGINTGEFFKKIEARGPFSFTIGTVGRISEQKNPSLFNDIALRFPEIQFIWVGEGDLRNLLYAKNIIVTGWVNREKVLEFVQKFNIYVQTSLWEGLPFTIIEAMILSKPIVATNVIGNKDTVKNSYNGYLCNNVIEFENAIHSIKNDTTLEESFGKNSHIMAKELFDRDTNFRKLIGIYSSAYTKG